MQYGLGRSRHTACGFGSPHPRHTSAQQAGEHIKAPHGFAIGCPVFAGWPQHAGVQLVANLHIIRSDPGSNQLAGHILGITLHLSHQLVGGQRRPGLGFELLARIGPEVAVVQIEHEGHILGLGSFSQSDDACQIRITATVNFVAG